MRFCWFLTTTVSFHAWRAPRLGALCCALATGTAWAEPVCPGEAPGPWPAKEQVNTFEQHLDLAQDRCSTNAAYWAYRGAWMLLRGQAEQAAILLERALMLDPDHAGAKLDYALALAATGDTASAHELWRELLTRPDLPAEARLAIEDHLKTPFKTQTSRWSTALAMTTRAGHDSNLNSAPSREQLTLTLPDGDALLALGEAYRPRAGRALVLDLRWMAHHKLPSGTETRVHVDFRRRNAAQASYQQLEGSVTWLHPFENLGLLHATLTSTGMRYEGFHVLNAHRLQIGREWSGQPLSDCRTRLAAETETRRYPVSASLNGRYTGVYAQLGCQMAGQYVGSQIRWGQDTAQDPARPGGTQWRREWRLFALIPMGGGRLDVESSFSHLRDTTGYSPLLEHNAVRQQTRQLLKLEYSHAVTPSIEVFASAEKTQQKSNLALFSNKGITVWTGLRMQLY